MLAEFHYTYYQQIIYTKSKMAQTYLMDYCKTYLPPIKALKMFHILLLQSSSKPTCRKPGTGKTGFLQVKIM